MKELKGYDTCYGCTACEQACPVHAITMRENEEGFLYPQVDEEKCIDCNLCHRICEQHGLCNSREQQVIYAAINKDPVKRESSSSGGVFTALAEYILKIGGAVYGAAFDADYQVVHVRVDRTEDLVRLRGSKYVQSILGDTYTKVRRDLSDNRKVLFSGTPCQVKGLEAFLQNKHENLLLCDVLCHGVPPVGIWRQYLTYISQNRKAIRHISFRNKEYGWRNQALCIDFENDRYIARLTECPYYILYFRHNILRPSCHNCQYARYERSGDITLGDFWGVEDSLQGKTLDDGQGVSVVMANTAKGKQLLQCAADQLILRESTPREAYQVILDGPVARAKTRDEFWKYYKNHTFEDVLRKYGRWTKKDIVVKKIIAPLTKKLGIYNLAQKIYFLRKQSSNGRHQ